MQLESRIPLSPTIELSRKMLAISEVYKKALNILTNRDIDVVVRSTGGRSPSFTDGQTITFNKSLIDLEDFDYIERLHGLVFHETAHILFSPRKNSVLRKWMVDGGARMLTPYNILEDQRIERFLLSRYPSTAPWVTMAILRWITKTGEIDKVYPLIAGRSHVPKKLRDTARKEYINQSCVDEIDILITAYKSLVFPSGYERAKEIVARFSELIFFNESGETINPIPSGIRVCGEVVSKGSLSTVKEQKQWRDSTNGNFDEEEEEEDTEDQGVEDDEFDHPEDIEDDSNHDDDFDHDDDFGDNDYGFDEELDKDACCSNCGSRIYGGDDYAG